MGHRALSALLWGYDLDEPSFRHRMRPLARELEARGWSCAIERLPKKRYLLRVLERRTALLDADVLILHRIKCLPPELWPLRRLSRRVVYDVDDAVYTSRRAHTIGRTDDSRLRVYKFQRTCAMADLVLACNSNLAQMAGRSSRRIEIVPTPVDVDAFDRAQPVKRDPSVVAWIGLPENLVYLELVRGALARLAKEFSQLRLRVISSHFPDWPDVPIERVLWSEEREIESLLSAGIGIMPLSDDDWTRGKCAFKLIQCMAARLPCVASPVGANLGALVDGDTGLFAADGAAWERALQTLLADPERAAAMGHAGYQRARELYDRRVVSPSAADLIAELVN